MDSYLKHERNDKTKKCFFMSCYTPKWDCSRSFGFHPLQTKPLTWTRWTQEISAVAQSDFLSISDGNPEITSGAIWSQHLLSFITTESWPLPYKMSLLSLFIWLDVRVKLCHNWCMIWKRCIHTTHSFMESNLTVMCLDMAVLWKSIHTPT